MTLARIGPRSDENGMPIDVKSRAVHHLTTALIVLLIAAPIILNLVFICKYGVNCVYADQWEMVPLFDKLYSGNLPFADLIAQHNEHRPFMPRIVALSLGSLTKYNTVAEMYFSWFLLCLICFIIFKLYVRSFGFSKISMAKFIPVVWLTFGLRQYEHMLRGDQISMFLEIMFFLLAIYLLSESKRLDWRFVLAVICGLACTFSLASGLLVWPICLIQILCCSRIPGRKLWGLDIGKVILWTIVGIAVYVWYFTGFAKPLQTPNMLYPLQQPYVASMFGLVALGNAVSSNMSSATLVGTLLLLLYIFMVGVAIFRPNILPVKFPFLSMIFFTLAAAATLVVTRSGWGVAAAFEPRYATLVTLGIIGLYILIISMDIKNIIVKYIFAVLLLTPVIAGIGPMAAPAYWEMGENVRATRQMMAYYVTTCNYQPDENLVQIYPSPDVVRARSEILAKYKLNVFSNAILSTAGLIPLNTVPYHKIEAVNDQARELPKLLFLEADKDDSLRLKGWAIDQNCRRAAGGVFLVVDGSLEVPALFGLDRPDVADIYGNGNYRYSGFEASVPASAIGPGRHVVGIKVISADGRNYYLPVEILRLNIK